MSIDQHVREAVQFSLEKLKEGISSTERDVKWNRSALESAESMLADLITKRDALAAFIHVPGVWDRFEDLPIGVPVRSVAVGSESGKGTHVYFKRTEDGYLNRWNYESYWYGPGQAHGGEDASYAPYTEVEEP